jgi:hypothetical protein
VLTHLTVPSIFVDLSHLDHVLSIYLNLEVISEYSASRHQTMNKTTAESDVDKAEALNDQFTGVFTKKAHDQVPSIHVSETRR